MDLMAEAVESAMVRHWLENSRPAGPRYSILVMAGEAEAGAGGDRPAKE
jgi:hypothetical protein